MRALPAFIVALFIAVAAGILAAHPGSVSLRWEDWHVDTSVGVLVTAVVLLATLSAASFHLLRRILGGPRAFVRARRERRRRQGYRALTQGMVAVAAGDAEEAQKYARKADVLLAEPPLTLLLSAQAAQLNGDEQAARRYFTAMLDRPETEFLGLRGLVMQALRGGDEDAALALAERARELRPRTPWVLSSLYELQARAGRWSEAATTLAEAAKRHALPAEESRHHRAVLLLEQSRVAAAAGDQRQALQHAAAAHPLDPGFASATVRYAELLAAGGNPKKAAKVIEAGWRAAPHPDLAAAWDALFATEPPMQRLKRTERLVAGNADHPESRMAQARAALSARLWGEARRHLEALGGTLSRNQPPSPRVCRAMAELEEAEHGDVAAARSWLAQATTTTALDPTYVCNACGAECQLWSALCPACRSFDSLAWRLPGGSARRLGAPSANLMPPLPVPGPWTAPPPSPAAGRG